MGSVRLDSKNNNPELFISGLTCSKHAVLLFKLALIFCVVSYYFLKLSMEASVIQDTKFLYNVPSTGGIVI